MFDAQMQMRAVATQIQVGVTPGVELRRSTERLTSAFMGSALAGMVHQRHGGAVMALQAAQITEKRSDLGSEVLIDRVQTDQWVEYEQFWLEGGDSGVERLLMLEVIEPKSGHSNDVDLEAVEVGARSGGDALETLAHDVRGIFGSKQQDGTTLSGWEAAQAGRAGGDGDGKSEREERFSTLGFATDMASSPYRW